MTLPIAIRQVLDFLIRLLLFLTGLFLTKNQLATVRGVDIFPPPVTWMPPNCIFEVDDVLREWTWREPFDFIHMRLMYGAFPPEGWHQLYKQAYE